MDSATLIAIALSSLVALLLVYRYLRTKPLPSPRESLHLLASMSAKLACSAHHISRFSDEKIHRDLRNYSPLFSLVRVSHTGTITKAQCGKFAYAQAQFDPILGAQLVPPTHQRDQAMRCTLRSPAPNPNYRTKLRDQISTHPPLQKLVERQLQEDVRRGLDTRALVVVQGDSVIAEAYEDGITANTKLLGWSMTKSVTAMLIGRMETLGLADAREHNLFPGWSRDARRHIGLENLLQMCDGLAFDERYHPATDVSRMLFGDQPASRYALQRPLECTPGARFSYSSGSTNLLARWMHKRLGGTEKLQAFLLSEFIRPMGLRSLLLETDGDGVFVGSSYGYADGRDWARLGTLLLNNGILRGKRVLDRGWIHRATAPNTSLNDSRYGYQLWLNRGREEEAPLLHPTLPVDSYFMLGNREQKLMVCPSQHAVIVRLGWSASPYPVESRFGELLDALPD
ncbi:serine hydrolase domain-containing protein [Microbulbifer mangrovi]|uniref:serine hydrolase domain-containing protein n=1 Tax=Microbulbifer mangrovi TaxID=927787 RepID=UPI000990666D|nr:serine hydrolase [Microbulbifer mangrovi]